MNPADWRIFDALTSEHPMLNDIRDWMLAPYSPVDIAKQKERDGE